MQRHHTARIRLTKSIYSKGLGLRLGLGYATSNPRLFLAHRVLSNNVGEYHYHHHHHHRENF